MTPIFFGIVLITGRRIREPSDTTREGDEEISVGTRKRYESLSISLAITPTIA